jgi:hypothetical protein
MKGFLKKYFNKNVLSGIAAHTAITGSVATALLLGAAVHSSSPAIMLGCAAVTAAITAGYMNKWNQAATGKFLWKPRTPFFGL